MPIYVGRFIKEVLGDNGHAEQVCQHVVEVEACDPDAARQHAIVSFHEAVGLQDWTLRADRLDIHPADVQS